MTNLDLILTQIANEHLDIPTLETRRSDSLDFHDVAVWQVHEALQAAYMAGLAAGARKPVKAKRANRA